MSKFIKYIWLLLLFGLLLLIRAFEDELFYDPYLKFFQSDYLYQNDQILQDAKF